MRRRSQPGYTLLELIVVMVIIMTVAAASMPTFLRYIGGSKLRGSAQNIVAALNGARRMAITQRQNYQVIVYMRAAATISNAVSFYETADTDKLQYMPSTIYIRDKEAIGNETLTYTFNPRGGVSIARESGSNSAYTVMVVRQDVAYVRWIEITIVPATGRVRMSAMIKI